MDVLRRDQQKATVLAFLLSFEIGSRCTLEDLSGACLVFSVTPAEIRRLCALPNVPLRLLDDRLVEVSKSFDISHRTSFVSLLRNQNNLGTDPSKNVVGPTVRKEDAVIVKRGSTPEPALARLDSDGVNAIKQEAAVTEIRPQIDSGTALLPTENGLATNGTTVHIHDDNSSNPPQETECHFSPHPANPPSDPPQPNEKAHPAIQEGNPCTHLPRTEKTDPAETHIDTPWNTPHRTEKSQLVTAAACLAEQGVVPLVNEINAQPKKKSRDPRSVPRFEDYDVDREVGAGGYGTVYKVLRHIDRQVFAMKCPLENTHSSCVRNEINMLKRLRGKDYIIQFQSELIGKVSPKSEAGGGEEVNCPSILLEFIEHDKPEVLKKEITIDELKCYSLSLFKALAQLHKERILHLDIKPGNFLFSRSTKKGCLVDFNLARDESAKRLSTRRPERCSSRGGTTEAKALERRKCPKRSLVHEDATLTCVKPSKRSRKLMESYPRLETSPANNVTCIGDQSKQTLGPAASKDRSVAASPKYQQLQQSRSNSATGAITEPLKANDNLDNTGTAQQLEISKTQQTVMRGSRNLVASHRLFKFFKENVYTNASCPSTPPFTQSKGVPALKPNPNKRVPAGVPPHPQAVVQPSSAKRVKPALKVKAACHPVKEGPCVGTKGYRAPEVLMRSTRQTTKVDIWSAGISLLQLVTGRSPFPSTSTEGALKEIAKMRGSANVDKLAKSLGQRYRFSKDSYQGTTVKEWSERHSRRTDLKGRIPSTLYDLIEKCLEVNPGSRISAEGALQHQFCRMDADTSKFAGHPNP